MYCTKCGTENDNGVKYCKSCGAPLQTAVSSSEKSSSKKRIGVIAVAVLALILVGLLVKVISSNVKTTIDLNKYVSIEVSGTEGNGRAKASIDWDMIEEDYGEKITFTEAASQQYGGLMTLWKPVELLSREVKVSLDKDRELSNGEEIHYTFKVPDDVSTYFECTFEFTDGSYTVSELTE